MGTTGINPFRHSTQMQHRTMARNAKTARSHTHGSHDQRLARHRKRKSRRNPAQKISERQRDKQRKAAVRKALSPEQRAAAQATQRQQRAERRAHLSTEEWNALRDREAQSQSQRRAAQPLGSKRAKQDQRSQAQLMQERTAAALRRARRTAGWTAEQEAAVRASVQAKFAGEADRIPAIKQATLSQLQLVIDALQGSIAKLRKMGPRKAHLLIDLCIATYVMQLCKAFGDAGWLRVSRRTSDPIYYIIADNQYHRCNDIFITKQLTLLHVPPADQQAVLPYCRMANVDFHWPQSMAVPMAPTVPDP